MNVLVHHVTVEAGGRKLPGDITIPADPIGLVLFAHGSGSSRLSPRNQFVAQELVNYNIATLLFDLLTEEEAANRANVFDIKLLAGRMMDATEWARNQESLATLPIGYFGASTGAAAALVAAAQLEDISAVVSRGGRPDLAGDALAQVRAPTLLIVGGRDEQVLELNRHAQMHITATCELAIIPGATHLFEEPGALEQAADLAGRWFENFLFIT